ncbi:hypothetical protein B0J12DRAFT_119703 [Macrophomina phaseolina]|uniref:Uncharacterized protein n=1 Tax=Macrophomina phaseolina TaxID=35725 RepID=A0ABQ8G7I5_9PEZI|nr:hypothetical protein B0J12DRAFT_119703 [Macrophomina phaseolina]
MSRCRSYGCLGRAPRPLQSALDTTRAANSTAAAWLPAAMCIAALGPCRHRQKRHPGAAGAGVGGALHEAARLDPGSHRRKRQRVVSPKSLTSALAGATEVQTRRPPAKAGVLRKRKPKLKPKPKLCSGTTPRLNTTRGRPAAKAVSVPIATHRAYASVQYGVTRYGPTSSTTQHILHKSHHIRGRTHTSRPSPLSKSTDRARAVETVIAPCVMCQQMQNVSGARASMRCVRPQRHDARADSPLRPFPCV